MQDRLKLVHLVDRKELLSIINFWELRKIWGIVQVISERKLLISKDNAVLFLRHKEAHNRTRMKVKIPYPGSFFMAPLMRPMRSLYMLWWRIVNCETYEFAIFICCRSRVESRVKWHGSKLLTLASVNIWKMLLTKWNNDFIIKTHYS